MRVAIFTDNDFEKINGVTTALAALLAYAPADISPRIYTASALATDAPDYLALPSRGVPIPFYSDMNIYLPRWREYRRRVIADRIDVLHLTTPGPMGLTALWVAAKTGVPLVGSFHTDLAIYTEMLSGSNRLGRLMGQYMRWMYGRCVATLVPSNATREMMIAAGSHAERVRLWTRGVDTCLFNPARRSTALRETWRVSERRPAVLYVGRLSREKGLEMLPAICDRLHARGVEHRLVISGDGPLRVWLTAQLPDAVFTGPLSRERVADVFASADVFVFPSATDTAGNVVLEAQAAGLPVVVSNAGGPKENMVNGVTGTVCAGREAAQWAAAIAALIAERQRGHPVAVAPREYALTRRWPVALTSVYQAYRDAARAAAVAPAAVHHAA